MAESHIESFFLDFPNPLLNTLKQEVHSCSPPSLCSLLTPGRLFSWQSLMLTLYWSNHSSKIHQNKQEDFFLSGATSFTFSSFSLTTRKINKRSSYAVAIPTAPSCFRNVCPLILKRTSKSGRLLRCGIYSS